MGNRAGRGTTTDAFVEALRLRLALDAGRLGTWRWEMASGTVEWDERLEAMFGFEPGQFDGTYESYVARLHPSERAEIQARVRRAVEDKAPYDLEHRIVWPDGTVRWIQGRGDVTMDASGTVTGTIGCVADITDRKRLEDRSAALLRRLSLQAEAATALADSLDLGDSLARLAELCVPHLADAVVVWLADDNGRPRLVVARHADPDGERALRALSEYQHAAGIGDVSLALEDGRVHVVDDVTDAVLRELAVDDEHLALLLEADIGAGVAVPIILRRRARGVIAFGVRRGKVLEQDTIDFAEDLARRMPHVIENALLFETATSVADALQAGLAPPPPPDVPGLDIAVRYQAAGHGVEIGGDFYDFVEVEGGHVLVVGDVCGRGPSAASLNAQVRFATRALARAGLSATELASSINDNVTADGKDSRFCTAVFARLQARDGLDAEIVTAGHPNPMIVRRDGTVDPVASSGPVLGIFREVAYESSNVRVAPGDTLVVFTDGMLEARNELGGFFEPELVPLLARVASRSADEIAQSLSDAVREFTGGTTSDDIAIVVIQPLPQ